MVDEEDFEKAVAFYVTLEKTVAEGAGAGGLAALLRYPERFKGKKVGLVLCGGNIDARMLAVVLNREMVREKRLVVYRILGDDRPGMLSKMSAVIGGAGRQHHRRGAQPAGAGRAGQGRGVRHHGRDARRPPCGCNQKGT